MMHENFLRRTWSISRSIPQQQRQDTNVSEQVPGLNRLMKRFKLSKAMGVATDSQPKGSSKSVFAIYPLCAIIALIIVVLAIGGTIAIALIPLYLSDRSVPPAPVTSNARNITIEIPIDQNLPLGPLDSSERAKLLDAIKASLPASISGNSEIRIVSAEVVEVPASGRRNVRQSKKVLKVVIEILSRIRALVNEVSNQISTIVSNPANTILQEIQQIVETIIENRPPTESSSTSSSSTVPPNLVSTLASNAGRRRRHDPDVKSTIQPMITYED